METSVLGFWVGGFRVLDFISYCQSLGLIKRTLTSAWVIFCSLVWSLIRNLCPLNSVGNIFDGGFPRSGILVLYGLYRGSIKPNLEDTTPKARKPLERSVTNNLKYWHPKGFY